MSIQSIAAYSRYLSQVNIKSTKAQLLQHSEPPQVKVTRQKGGLTMESHPIKLDIDNRAFFDSIGLKSTSALADENIAKGQKAVMDSMAEYAQEADIMFEPHNNNAIGEIAVMRASKTIESVLAFIPEESPKLNWSGGDVDISYKPDKLNFAWDTGGIESRYIPYQVEYTVVE